MSRRLRVGAIGAGWWATTNHFPLLAARDDVELIGVVRPDEEILHTVKKEFGFQTAFTDYRDLLKEDLDAVIVSTPHHVHFEHTMAALASGAHTLCEKPMTLTALDAWKIVKEAERREKNVLVPFGWNYAPFIVEARRALHDVGIGEVEYVQAFMASPTKQFFSGAGTVPSQWTPSIASPDPGTWQNPLQGGGYAHGQLSHLVALALWLTDLRGVSVRALASGPGAGVDLYNCSTVAFNNGAQGTLAGAGTLPDDDKFQVDIRLFGSEGVLLLDVERERAEIRRHDGVVWSASPLANEGAYQCVEPLNRFVDLALGRDVENNSPAELGARTVEIVAAIQESSFRDGEKVFIEQLTLAD
ncbi:gfo/Idh/MocA family oxidoreductase [Nakamurella antarctica]|uniref:Gfo/Idh/MocA family oxidoreductase n=1 Tax=Nakamurella antarctica TaxID=1902245 RepID=A0A3G8ZNQ1_9ACTN|nr:Gfo/Idh/MocA family oxidoreductase [Nakamurella antarctica]AZI58437.1 gfo/Idh/MocA family oxidoreductase [Nakamurella antarctica]